MLGPQEIWCLFFLNSLFLFDVYCCFCLHLYLCDRVRSPGTRVIAVLNTEPLEEQPVIYQKWGAVMVNLYCHLGWMSHPCGCLRGCLQTSLTKERSPTLNVEDILSWAGLPDKILRKWAEHPATPYLAASCLWTQCYQLSHDPASVLSCHDGQLTLNPSFLESLLSGVLSQSWDK